MVRAVRGAITVISNTSEEIIVNTSVILKEIIKENNIETGDIISIFFTVTKDLDAAFPAVAARNIGLTDIALLCTNEIDVPGSLDRCIRVMMHFNTDKKNEDVKHIYMNEAKKLRPDLAGGSE